MSSTGLGQTPSMSMTSTGALLSQASFLLGAAPSCSGALSRASGSRRIPNSITSGRRPSSMPSPGRSRTAGRAGRPLCPLDWKQRLTSGMPQLFPFEPEVGNGWIWLIASAANHLSAVNTCNDMRTHDLKDKYGTLRWDIASVEFHQEVEEYTSCVDRLSGYICEIAALQERYSLSGLGSVRVQSTCRPLDPLRSTGTGCGAAGRCGSAGGSWGTSRDHAGRRGRSGRRRRAAALPPDRGPRRPCVGQRRGGGGARPPGAVRLRYQLDEPGFRAGGRVVTAAAAVWFEADGLAWIEGGGCEDLDFQRPAHGRDALDAAEGLACDLAICAGDVADGLTKRSIPWLREHVVPRAREVVYVPGNHDFWRPDTRMRSRPRAKPRSSQVFACSTADNPLILRELRSSGDLVD